MQSTCDRWMPSRTNTASLANKWYTLDGALPVYELRPPSRLGRWGWTRCWEVKQLSLEGVKHGAQCNVNTCAKYCNVTRCLYHPTAKIGSTAGKVAKGARHAGQLGTRIPQSSANKVRTETQPNSEGRAICGQQMRVGSTAARPFCSGGGASKHRTIGAMNCCGAKIRECMHCYRCGTGGGCVHVAAVKRGIAPPMQQLSCQRAPTRHENPINYNEFPNKSMQ
eukprot:8383449-Pyramimonas_sp.AAC.3